MKVLYISYDGMTDPLGRSQVIPYLQGLSKEGHEFYLLSFEKKINEAGSREVNNLLAASGIQWFPMHYSSRPAVISTLYDLWRMKCRARKLVKQYNITMVHCRSYIAALAGLMLKKKTGIKFVFDMRGFWADERVDGKIWNLDKPVYRWIYKYFKNKEKEFLHNADYIISLTQNGKDEIEKWNITSSPIQVIPCCADLEMFSNNSIIESEKHKFNAELGIPAGTFVLSYLGSVGTWYMLPEMLDFFKVILSKRSNAIFLFITPDRPAIIMDIAAKKGIMTESLRVIRAKRNDVPALLSLSDASIFFIKPVFSKKASSPTKMGEIMGLGIPVICNSGVGDVDIIAGSESVIIPSFDTSEYEKAADLILDKSAINPYEVRSKAEKFFSLSNGIKKYGYVYNNL